jgi:hypothetical protein
MKEILLSFHLLFRDDKRSRTYYRRTARHGAAMTDMDGNRSVDPTLDLLCGFYPSSCDPPMRSHLPYRVAYYPESDFPILRNRLLKLYLYIDGIQPMHLRSLWRDRRDRRQWWAIWTAIVIGLITVVQSSVTIALTIVQIFLQKEAI